MAKVEPKAKRVMGREEFPYEHLAPEDGQAPANSV